VTQVLILSEDEIERTIDLDELAEALRSALVAITATRVSVPARTAAVAPRGLLGAMPGYVPGIGLGAKLVSIFPGDSTRGWPSHQGVVVLFDEDGGAPLAVLDGTYLTGIRTAVAAAVAAKALARPDSQVVAVLGAGVQARRHAEVFDHFFPDSELRIAARDPESASAIAEQRPALRCMRSFEDAVRGADIVCCCTGAKEPVVADGWLSAGAHVSSVGSGREVPPATIERAEVFVESLDAVLPAPAGTVELEGRDRSTLTCVGDVLSGIRRGRSGPDALTVYKSMGHAGEDLAAASLVLARARRAGIGTTVAL
jgi:alanine dehydrogenase